MGVWPTAAHAPDYPRASARSPTRLLSGCSFPPQRVDTPFARLRLSEAGEQLVGKIAQYPSQSPGIFCGVGPVTRGKICRCLQRRCARDGVLEAATLAVLAQPACELFVLGRVWILHADHDPEVLCKSHVGVTLTELLQELQSTRGEIVWLGR